MWIVIYNIKLFVTLSVDMFLHIFDSFACIGLKFGRGARGHMGIVCALKNKNSRGLLLCNSDYVTKNSGSS